MSSARAARRPRDVVGRGAGAHHQHFFRLDGDRRRSPRDRLAFGDHHRLAVADGLLVGEGPGGAAVGAVDELPLVQLHQIAADGLAGDAEPLGEFRGAQASGRRSVWATMWR